MRGQQILTNGFDLTCDSFVLFQHIKELIVVHFEFLLLKEDDPGTLRDWDTLPIETFCLSNKLHYINIEVNI